jgi:transposase
MLWGGLRTRNFSVMCAMNKEGLFHYSVQSRAYNTVSFMDALRSLFEKLRCQNISNAVLIADNVPFHKANCVRELVEQNGHRLMFLPPYSPFMNPIENMFAKWKEAVRNNRPENEEALIQLIEQGASLITRNDCDGYFRHTIGFLDRCLNRAIIVDE